MTSAVEQKPMLVLRPVGYLRRSQYLYELISAFSTYKFPLQYHTKRAKNIPQLLSFKSLLNVLDSMIIIILAWRLILCSKSYAKINQKKMADNKSCCHEAL